MLTGTICQFHELQNLQINSGFQRQWIENITQFLYRSYNNINCKSWTAWFENVLSANTCSSCSYELAAEKTA